MLGCILNKTLLKIACWDTFYKEIDKKNVFWDVLLNKY